MLLLVSLSFFVRDVNKSVIRNRLEGDRMCRRCSRYCSDVGERTYSVDKLSLGDRASAMTGTERGHQSLELLWRDQYYREQLRFLD